MSRLRSARGTDGDVGQKERGSAGAVLLPERWGCLAAAPPALEPDRFPSPPPPPTPCVVSVSLRGSRGRACLLVALTARLRLCAAWGAREAFGGLWGGSWGGRRGWAAPLREMGCEKLEPV